MSAQMAAREQKLLALRFAQGFKGQIHRAPVRIRPRSFRLDQIETPVEIFQSDNERVTPLDNARVLANDLKNWRISYSARCRARVYLSELAMACGPRSGSEYSSRGDHCKLSD